MGKYYIATYEYTYKRGTTRRVNLVLDNHPAERLRELYDRLDENTVLVVLIFAMPITKTIYNNLMTITSNEDENEDRSK